MSLTIKSFIASNGERFSQLYDSGAGGFPMFYPTAYLSRSIRLTCSHETQKVYLEAIKRLLEWEREEKIDILSRFQRRELLRPNEIDGLTASLSRARNGKSGETISASKSNTYISYASGYLKWFANEVITDAGTPVISKAIETQESLLLKKLATRTGSKSSTAQKVVDARLSEHARQQLTNLWQNPFVNTFRASDNGARLRTVVMLRILYETGMRRGELLALKLKHIKESTGGETGCLVIERNHNDSYDTRVHQPVAKTVGRIVPITPQLEQQIEEYITDYRSVVPRVGFDGEDQIFVTHRGGQGQGKAMSITNFNQALAGLKTIFPKLVSVYPHLIRHDWNYRFSKQADAEKLQPEKERELREILMGWQTGSSMAQRYNLRHIQEQSLNFGAKVAEDTCRPPPARPSE